MSDVPQIPRLLATLLGVEPPAPSGPRRATPLPAPQPPSDVPAAPAGQAAQRVGRRPTERSGSTDGSELPRASSRTPSTPPASVGSASARARSRELRSTVRQVLFARDALRAGVVVAEVLGPPRALRAYGEDMRG